MRARTVEALLWIAVSLMVPAAFAQPYPSRTIRIIVPYPAGGGTDTAARLIGQKMSASLGRSVIIENRAGANGNIGTDATAKAAADGYTLGMATPGPVTIGKTLYANLPYDPERDLQPVILVNASPNVLGLHPSVPARSVAELVALAKLRPLHMGVSTIASVQHLLGEMFNHASGAKLQIIAYKGGAQVATDVIGGQIESLWSVLPVVLPMIHAGRLRALAIASEKRSALLPAVPTTVESGLPSVIGIAWNGVVVPAGTPRMVVDQLNSTIAQSLRAADVTERFTAIGMEAIGGSADAFGAFLRTDTARWAKVIRMANVKVE